jgi:hypothetical protein
VEIMILRKLAHWLRHSRHVHIRESGVHSLPDLVNLVDRFLDDELRYGWEWDDFVSWDNSSPAIEAIRERIAQAEPLFFSKDPAQIARGVEILLEERNRAASLIGESIRPLDSDGAPPNNSFKPKPLRGSA